jgi:hypothetical protein
MLRPASILGDKISDQPQSGRPRVCPIDANCPAFTGRSMLRPYKTGIRVAQLCSEIIRQAARDCPYLPNLPTARIKQVLSGPYRPANTLGLRMDPASR